MATDVRITPPPLSNQSLADLLCALTVLCRGINENGKSFWAYIRIKPSMAHSFHEACEGTFNLEDYGTVIEYGEGEYVPRHVRQRMEKAYAINHDYETELRLAIKKLRH